MKRPIRTYTTVIDGQEVEVKVYRSTKRMNKPWTRKIADARTLSPARKKR